MNIIYFLAETFTRSLNFKNEKSLNVHKTQVLYPKKGLRISVASLESTHSKARIRMLEPSTLVPSPDFISLKCAVPPCRAVDLTHEQWRP